jgi:hypothetical protein
MELFDKQLDLKDDLSKRIELKANTLDMNERMQKHEK